MDNVGMDNLSFQPVRMLNISCIESFTDINWLTGLIIDPTYHVWCPHSLVWHNFVNRHLYKCSWPRSKSSCFCSTFLFLGFHRQQHRWKPMGIPERFMVTRFMPTLERYIWNRLFFQQIKPNTVHCCNIHSSPACTCFFLVWGCDVFLDLFDHKIHAHVGHMFVLFCKHWTGYGTYHPVGWACS